MNPSTLLQESASFRRTVVLMVLIAILLFDWQPDPRLLAAPAQKRQEDRPLPEDDSNLIPRAARQPHDAHFDEPARPLPGARQAARRRSGRRG